MGKKILTICALLLISFIFSACTKTASDSNANSFSAADIVSGAADVQIKLNADKNLAIAKAKELWGNAFQMEEDLSSGPCLANNLIPDWVADIAHNPRTSADDDPTNQCSAYVNGTAHHFVELDPEGNLIRAQ
ncbi:MAG: hypothetical protein WC544_01610 [Patescibacteria group bacterium]